MTFRAEFPSAARNHPFSKECKIAISAAQGAGLLMQQMQQNKHKSQREITNKGVVDFVSTVDLACEERICAHLQQCDFEILAEERGGAINSGSRWIVDPLDGTTNYLHGFPAYAVSIALQIDGVIQLGVIYNPVLNEMFVAMHGAGAWCNNRPIQCSGARLVSESLLATGFPYDRHNHASVYLSLVEQFMIRCRGIRRAGSAALDLAHVACGRLDGFWEHKLQSWDVAAGVLLVEEAGGVVTDLSGSQLDINFPEPLAASPGLHEQMLNICRNHATQP